MGLGPTPIPDLYNTLLHETCIYNDPFKNQGLNFSCLEPSQVFAWVGLEPKDFDLSSLIFTVPGTKIITVYKLSVQDI